MDVNAVLCCDVLYCGRVQADKRPLSRRQCLGIRPQLTWLHSSSWTRQSQDETGPAKPPKMAPNLSAAQHEQLAGMIEFSALSDAQIAE